MSGILALDALANNQPYLYNFSLLNQCKWSGCLIYSVAATIISLSPTAPLVLYPKNSGTFLPHRHPKHIPRSHVSIHTKAKIHGLIKTFLILFRVPDVTDSDQGTHFTFQYINNAGLLKKTFKDLSPPCRFHTLGFMECIMAYLNKFKFI